ncbi:MAG: hypothetical protein KAJ72_02330 [Candidatus Heimdallarchaeota archaeon]|nr:hypothetical protein [Candidatus Heimdallarchaeota archaeon]MCK5409300.1 hypothetical protein [Candidatus Heimdallarchaeota archaeon]
MTTKNPHEICIWKSKENCSDCGLKGRLHCHLNIKYSIIFGIPFFIAFIPAFVGLILLGFPLNLISILSWMGYIVFFFLVWEPRILCSHCPYYAEGKSKTLHCSINYGFLKTSKFKPGPMSKFENAQFLIGANIIFLIPVVFLIIWQLWIYLGITVFGVVLWYIFIQLYVCKDCVNFSCILNRVPKKERDEFLKKNPTMYKAWKESGYQFDDEENK